MKPKSKKVLSLVLAVATLFLLTNCNRYSPTDAKFKEVERLYNGLHIYPGFQPVGGASYSKSIDKYYKSDASYDDVKKFYSAELVPAGWQLTKERTLKDWWRDFGGRELTFGKGQYSVVIEYRGDQAIDPDWNYAINVGWDD